MYFPFGLNLKNFMKNKFVYLSMSRMGTTSFAFFLAKAGYKCLHHSFLHSPYNIKGEKEQYIYSTVSLANNPHRFTKLIDGLCDFGDDLNTVNFDNLFKFNFKFILANRNLKDWLTSLYNLRVNNKSNVDLEYFKTIIYKKNSTYKKILSYNNVERFMLGQDKLSLLLRIEQSNIVKNTKEQKNKLHKPYYFDSKPQVVDNALKYYNIQKKEYNNFYIERICNEA